MKHSKELCEQLFAQLTIEEKRWLIDIAMIAQGALAIEATPKPMDATRIAKSSEELRNKARRFNMGMGRYYDILSKVLELAGDCIVFLHANPELPENEES